MGEWLKEIWQKKASQSGLKFWLTSRWSHDFEDFVWFFPFGQGDIIVRYLENLRLCFETCNIYFLFFEKNFNVQSISYTRSFSIKKKENLLQRENAPKNPYESFVQVIQSTKQKNFRKVVCTISTAKSTYDLPCGGTKYYLNFVFYWNLYESRLDSILVYL